jgi:hypothetical protein
MATDRLHSFVKHYIDSCDPSYQGIEDVLHNAVGDYMAELMSAGNIPHSQLDPLEQDLREEALAIYRKLTYGFLTFRDYHEYRRQQKYSC